MKKRLLIATLLVVATVAVTKWLARPTDDEASEPNLVFDRIWIDHVPKNPKDVFNVFVAISQRQRVGVFQSASQWKGAYELFNHRAGGDALEITFPQTDEREVVRVHARRCTERDMEFCLDLDGGSRGVKRYFSRRGLELDNLSPPGQVLDRIAAFARPAE